MASFCITLLLLVSAGLCLVSYSHAKMLGMQATSPAYDSEVPQEQLSFALFEQTFVIPRYALRDAEAFLHQHILHVPMPLRLVLWQKQAIDQLFAFVFE